MPNRNPQPPSSSSLSQLQYDNKNRKNKDIKSNNKSNNKNNNNKNKNKNKNKRIVLSDVEGTMENDIFFKSIKGRNRINTKDFLDLSNINNMNNNNNNMHNVKYDDTTDNNRHSSAVVASSSSIIKETTVDTSVITNYFHDTNEIRMKINDYDHSMLNYSMMNNFLSEGSNSNSHFSLNSQQSCINNGNDNGNGYDHMTCSESSMTLESQTQLQHVLGSSNHGSSNHNMSVISMITDLKIQNNKNNDNNNNDDSILIEKQQHEIYDVSVGNDNNIVKETEEEEQQQQVVDENANEDENEQQGFEKEKEVVDDDDDVDNDNDKDKEKEEVDDLLENENENKIIVVDENYIMLHDHGSNPLSEIILLNTNNNNDTNTNTNTNNNGNNGFLFLSFLSKSSRNHLSNTSRKISYYMNHVTRGLKMTKRMLLPFLHWKYEHLIDLNLTGMDLNAGDIVEYIYHWNDNNIDNNNNNNNNNNDNDNDNDNKSSSAFGFSSSILNLNLSNNKLDAMGTKLLGHAIVEKSILINLQILNLSSNSLGPMGALAMAQLLMFQPPSSSLPNNNNNDDDNNNKSSSYGQLSHLITLDLSDNMLGQEGIHYLSRALQSGKVTCTLKNLILDYNNIGNETGCVSLRDALITPGCPGIENLSLKHNHLGNDGIRYLSEAFVSGKLHSLKEIHLEGNAIGDEGCLSLAAALSSGRIPDCFQNLHLAWNQITCAGFAVLGKALMSGKAPRDLEVLDFHRNQIKCDGVIDFCTSMTSGTFSKNIKLIDLSCNYIAERGGKAFGLALSHEKFGPQGLEIIKLSSNQIGSIAICDGFAVSFKKRNMIRNLKILHFTDNLIDDNGIEAFIDGISSRFFPKLFKEISFAVNKITSEGMEKIHHLMVNEKIMYNAEKMIVEKLMFAGNNIGDNGGYAFAEAICLGLGPPKLSDLCFDFCNLGNVGGGAMIESLMASTISCNLKKFNLSGNHINGDALKPLFTCPGAGIFIPNLEEINLEHNKIGDTGITALGIALENSTTPLVLKKINVGSNDINSSGFKSFLKSLSIISKKYTSSVEELIFDHNCLGLEGCIALHEILNGNDNDILPQTLQTLDISFNRIESKGCKKIANLLSKNKFPNSLQTLNISNNRIGTHGCRYLALSLKSGKCPIDFANLLVCDNGITDQGGLDILHALSTFEIPSQLNKINLMYNKINDTIIHRIDEALCLYAQPIYHRKDQETNYKNKRIYIPSRYKNQDEKNIGHNDTESNSTANLAGGGGAGEVAAIADHHQHEQYSSNQYVSHVLEKGISDDDGMLIESVSHASILTGLETQHTLKHANLIR